MKGWRIYNHCWMPTCAAKETPDLSPIKTGEIWREGGLFAQWTTDFDCQEETGWWHVIKSEPFDIASLKAKRRWEIKKGSDNFEVRKLLEGECCDDVINILKVASADYSVPFTGNLKRSTSKAESHDNLKREQFGAFDRLTGKLCAWATIGTEQGDRCVHYISHKALPREERRYVNAALVAGLLEHFKDLLANGWYIDDGARSVLHDTHFQQYLAKYFGFRKAYCKMHFIVNPKIRFAVGVLFRLRALVRLLKKLCNAHVLRQIDGVMTMMEVSEERKYGWRLPKGND